MSKRLQKNIELLKILKKAELAQRKAILKTLNNEQLLCICECIDNILCGNVKISPVKKRELSKHVKILRKLVDKETDKEQKRKLLVQKGGFLPALLAPIIAIAGSLIGDLVGKLK